MLGTRGKGKGEGGRIIRGKVRDARDKGQDTRGR
jgi:hypothetical protein